MATPKEALTGTNHNININNANAAPKNQHIETTDTVTLQNNDTNNAATVTFQGAGANEFGANPITIAAGGDSGALTPATPNVTVDYQVSQGGATGYAFSIEVGTGPLEIDIDASGATNLEHAGIPNNGTLFFKNQSPTQQASITFGGDSNVLFLPNGSPAPNPFTVAANTSSVSLTGRGTNKNVSYDIAMQTMANRVETGGNGSIKVGQT